MPLPLTPITATLRRLLAPALPCAGASCELASLFRRAAPASAAEPFRKSRRCRNGSMKLLPSDKMSPCKISESRYERSALGSTLALPRARVNQEVKILPNNRAAKSNRLAVLQTCDHL